MDHNYLLRVTRSSMKDAKKKFFLALLIASVTLFFMHFKANQSCWELEHLALSSKWSRSYINLRISGGNHFRLCIVPDVLRFHSMFTFLAALKRQYRVFTMSSTSSKRKAVSHGVSSSVFKNFAWSSDMRTFGR